MHIVFLGSRLPLTKTFVQNQGVLTATPYPQVSKVSSYHEQAKDLVEFKALLERHADQGHCLFNGQLTTPLFNESRAGKTKTGIKREWVVFDFDKVEAKDAADVVARYLPRECQTVSYIAQLSASMFRPDTTLWSGHIFMLLREPIDQMRLKQWFEYLNFTQPTLSSSLSLSDSLQALHWPLDRTVAYDSKLIYIAPPKCHGFSPAVSQHITLVKKKQTHLSIPTFQPIDASQVRLKINELRRAVGESEIDYDLTTFEGEEMLRKTGLCDISGLRASGDHYVRFNLNGGDSYAYFIDLRNIDVIRNFKGEPLLKTADAAPDLYKSLRKAAPRALAKPPLDDGAEVLAFYATNRGAQIKTGLYEPIKQALRLDDSTPTAARAWLAEFGLVQKTDLPHMDMVFDPTSDVQYIPGRTFVNTFRITPYMTRTRSSDKPSTLAELPPTTRKVFYSMLGNPTDAVFNHFMNWLAFIFQRREKAQTAWVFSGRTGTGKGSFVKYFLRPLFGPEHVRTIQFPLLTTQFNGYLENCLFLICEEADMNTVQNKAELNAKIRHYITDSPIEINQKGVKTAPQDSYCNLIFMANERTAVTVTGDDRRLNIAERQEVQLILTPNELTTLANGTELEQLSDILQRWPVDAFKVTRVIETQAQADMHEATTQINQLIAEAVIKGDLQFFIDRMPSDAESQADFFNRFNPLPMFKTLLEECLDHAKKQQAMVLTSEQLFVLFRTMIPDTKYFQDNKTWRNRHFKQLGLNIDGQHRLPGHWDKKKRGVKVDWKAPTDFGDFESADGKVVPIKKKRVMPE